MKCALVVGMTRDDRPVLRGFRVKALPNGHYECIPYTQRSVLGRRYYYRDDTATFPLHELAVSWGQQFVDLGWQDPNP